jgi:predicted nucleic acid-binding protein
MPETIVITDTSCLIALDRSGALDILSRLYRRIIITEEIREEYVGEIPSWIEVVTVPDPKYQRVLERILDKGEASAIALAVSLKDVEDVLLVLDDLKARKEAKCLGFRITGTLGILFRAKQEGLIPALKPYIDKLESTGFRISPAVIGELLALSNEL